MGSPGRARRPSHEEPRRRNRLPRLVLEVGPVELVELRRRRARSSMPVDRVDAVGPHARAARCSRAEHRRARSSSRPRAARRRRSGACAARDSTASSRSSASSEISSVAVARDAERRALGDLHLREEPVEVVRDHRSRAGSAGRASPTATKRGSASGTFTRAKRSSPDSGSRTVTPRLSDRPEMYGNGWPGPTASGVRTGIDLAARSAPRARRSSSSVASSTVPTRIPSRGERRAELVAPEPRLARRQLERRARAPRRASAAACARRASAPMTRATHLVEQAGDAHHEELVEDRRDDPAELARARAAARSGRRRARARASFRSSAGELAVQQRQGLVFGIHSLGCRHRRRIS